MNQKNKIWIFFVLLVLGVLLGGYSWNKKENSYEKKVQLSAVYTIKNYIPAGRRVTKNDVEKKMVPIAYLQPGAIGEFPADIRLARLSLLPGEQLTESKLIDERSSISLSWSLPVGQVAVTLSLNADQAVGFSIVPGDQVAVIGNDGSMRVLLPQVPVLNIHRFTRDSNFDSQWAQAEGPSLFTLSMSLKEAALLAQAREKGPLLLALLPAMSDLRE